MQSQHIGLKEIPFCGTLTCVHWQSRKLRGLAATFHVCSRLAFSPSLIMAMAGTNCFTANNNVRLGGHPGSCSMGRCYGNTPGSQSCTKTNLGRQLQPKLHTRNELVHLARDRRADTILSASDCYMYLGCSKRGDASRMSLRRARVREGSML